MTPLRLAARALSTAAITLAAVVLLIPAALWMVGKFAWEAIEEDTRHDR